MVLCFWMLQSEREDVEGRCRPPWIRRREASGTAVRNERRVVRFAIEVSEGMERGIAVERWGLVIDLRACMNGLTVEGRIESCVSLGGSDLLSPEICLMKIWMVSELYSGDDDREETMVYVGAKVGEEM